VVGQSCVLPFFVLVAVGLFSAFAVAEVPATVAAVDTGVISAEQLKCNGLVQPGVNASDKLMFGWVLRSSRSDERQSAY
jgi:hypothetical protein